MFLRSLLLTCLVLLTTGCPKSSYELMHPNPVPTPPHNSKKTLQIPAVTRVYVEGKFNVRLHTGYSHPHIVLSGDPRDLAHVVTTIKNDTVHLSLSKTYPRYLSVQADIYGHYLNTFDYHGTGTITGNRLHTSLLDLVIDNKGNTTLSGNLGLRKLELSGDGTTEISGINSPLLMAKFSGKQRIKTSGIVNLSTLDIDNNSWLTLYWVKSKVLTVRGRGQSFIQLAGVVEHLDVELWGTSQFKGRYLRAERAFIKTHNKSVAEVSAVKRQHTLAKDASDIQFFNIPVMKADFMANDGAVLDMRDLGLPFIQEYNQYNK